jgi:hypothetical protein
VIMEREDPTRSRGFGSSPLVPLALCALYAVCGGAEMKWSSVVGGDRLARPRRWRLSVVLHGAQFRHVL